VREGEKTRNELEKLALAISIEACPNRKVGCLDTHVRGATFG